MYDNIKDYTKIEDCIHNGFYHVGARNFYFGVFNKENGFFYGIRHKFGIRFIDQELHWDLNEKFGTAKPIEFIKICPIDDINAFDREMDDWMQDWINKEAELFFENKIKEVANAYKVGVDELQYRGISRIEWICEHGVGHTIWSPFNFFEHGCDGCCQKILNNKEQ